MPRFLIAALCLLACGTFSFGAGPTVRLEKEASGIKVLVGDDVFTVFRFEKERRKPYLYPVSAAGGYELLKKAVADEPADAEARQVVVVSDSATLKTESGETEKIPFGTVLTAEKVDGNQISFIGKKGTLSRSDIMPLASTVVRLINDDPNAGKDRKSPNYYDHPHHKGIWFAVDEINDIKFWMEDSLVVVKSVKIEKESGETATFRVVSEWLDKENHPLLEQTTLITVTGNRLISYDATLKVVADKVHIGDTKEGMFAIRLAPKMPEKISKGPVTTSEGVTGTNAAWGKPARWINYVGPVLGKNYAVTMMDSSSNPWPSRYHVRDYGLFAANPFGDGAYTEKTDAPQPKHKRDLKRGDSLRFQYGLWVHDADSDNAAIEKAYQELVQLSNVKF